MQRIVGGLIALLTTAGMAQGSDVVASAYAAQADVTAVRAQVQQLQTALDASQARVKALQAQLEVERQLSANAAASTTALQARAIDAEKLVEWVPLILVQRGLADQLSTKAMQYLRMYPERISQAREQFQIVDKGTLPTAVTGQQWNITDPRAAAKRIEAGKSPVESKP